MVRGVRVMADVRLCVILKEIYKPIDVRFKIVGAINNG